MSDLPLILLEPKLSYEYVDMCEDPRDVESRMETLRTALRRASNRIDQLEALIKATVEDLRMRAPWDDGEAELVVDLSDSIYRELNEAIE